MSSLKTELRLPVHGDGWVQLTIDIPDLSVMDDRDRAFTLSLIGKLSELATACGKHPGPPVIRPLLQQRPDMQHGGRP